MKHNLKKKKDIKFTGNPKIFLTGRKRHYFDRKMLSANKALNLFCHPELSSTLRCRESEQTQGKLATKGAHKLAEENVMDTIFQGKYIEILCGKKKKKKNSRDMFVTVLASKCTLLTITNIRSIISIIQCIQSFEIFSFEGLNTYYYRTHLFAISPVSFEGEIQIPLLIPLVLIQQCNCICFKFIKCGYPISFGRLL